MKVEDEIKLIPADPAKLNAAFEGRISETYAFNQPYLTTDGGSELSVRFDDGRTFLVLKFDDATEPFEVEVTDPEEAAELLNDVENDGRIKLDKGWEARCRQMIRASDGVATYEFTIKGKTKALAAAGRKGVRNEINITATQADFFRVTSQTVGTIIKLRHEISLGNHPVTGQPVILELDQYQGPLDGHWAAEFEKKNGVKLWRGADERPRFEGNGDVVSQLGEVYAILPAVFEDAYDATDDKRFKNGELARKGWPEGGPAFAQAGPPPPTL